jgi:hypothetical protein
MLQVVDMQRMYDEDSNTAAGQKWKLPPSGQPVSLFGNPSRNNDDATEGPIERRCTMRPKDDSKLNLLCFLLQCYLYCGWQWKPFQRILSLSWGSIFKRKGSTGGKSVVL